MHIITDESRSSILDKLLRVEDILIQYESKIKSQLKFVIDLFILPEPYMISTATTQQRKAIM